MEYFVDKSTEYISFAFITKLALDLYYISVRIYIIGKYSQFSINAGNFQQNK